MPEKSNFYMYTMSLPPMRRGRVEKQLGKRVRFNGEVMAYADFVALLVAQDHRPRDREYLTRTGGTAMEYTVMKDGEGYSLPSKTLYDFALYLVNQGAVTKESQQTLRDQENTHVAEIERIKRDEQARIDAENARKTAEYNAFKDWIRMQIPEYLHDPRIIILQDIFGKLHGGGRSAYMAELLVLFDHLDDPRVRERLCESLHPDNKASRLCFTAVTGITLPKGVKASREFLLSLDEKEEAV